MANNTAQFGLARLGLISLGKGLSQSGNKTVAYAIADSLANGLTRKVYRTVAHAIADSSDNGVSNYFISAWVQEPTPTVNPLFVLLNGIDKCLQDLENRTPKSVVKGSTEIEEKSPLYINSLNEINKCLQDLENRTPKSVMKGSTEIEEKSPFYTNSLCKVNCKLDKLKKKKAERS